MEHLGGNLEFFRSLCRNDLSYKRNEVHKDSASEKTGTESENLQSLAAPVIGKTGGAWITLLSEVIYKLECETGSHRGSRLG